jgi:RTX calcium-binding nonapeptide repeat (4 copies)
MSKQHHGAIASVISGGPGADSLSGGPGDTVVGRAGNDTIDLSAQLFTGPDQPRAFAFGGPGDDTIIDHSFFISGQHLQFAVTAFGGRGNDTFIGPSFDDPNHTTFFTGGPGHDLFVFNQAPMSGVTNTTITDFGKHDAIRLDNLGANPHIQITAHGSFTEVSTQGPANTLDLHLAGHFDPNKFHITNDDGHVFITYGHGGDWFFS